MNNLVLRALKSNKKYFNIFNNAGSFSTNTCCQQVSRPVFKQPTKAQRIDPFGWFLLVIPISTFGLGVWQVQRKQWKENLIAQLKNRTSSDPIVLPESMEEIKKLEYRPVHVRGMFLHDKEIYIGPRTLLSKGESTTESRLLSDKSRSSQGYLVVTPFKLEDRDKTILVNRGWVPSNQIDPKKRLTGQTEGIVDVIGHVRLNENRPNFTMKNREGSNLFFYRDLTSMCAATGADPIFLDQTDEFNTPGGPIGGQTRVTLRNEHFSYILTWFSLSAATSYMWYMKFIATR